MRRQASQQLGPAWTLMRGGTPGCPAIPEWLAGNVPEGGRVGIDPFVHTVRRRMLCSCSYNMKWNSRGTCMLFFSFQRCAYWPLRRVLYVHSCEIEKVCMRTMRWTHKSVIDAPTWCSPACQ